MLWSTGSTGLTELMATLYLTFRGTAKLADHFTFPPTMYEASKCFTSSPTLIVSVFLIINIQ